MAKSIQYYKVKKKNNNNKIKKINFCLKKKDNNNNNDNLIINNNNSPLSNITASRSATYSTIRHRTDSQTASCQSSLKNVTLLR